ncbi:MAG: TonB-dependent receptor [Cytophagaceae bacterium]|nr:TonB-dependent receptor [Gemmatimonadaceae bacterium]
MYPRLALALFAAAFALAMPASAQTFGRIAGTISAAEGTGGLSGAAVAVVGTTLATTTDDNGRYVLPRVPAGNVQLRVHYLGRRAELRDVSVTAGATVRVDVPMTLISLAPVVVEGVRAKGQAEALSRQRNAANIMSIVSSDQMGRFPDASAPEAAQRLPGVAIERDQGEGRYVKIRGAAAANTQVTVNGEQVPSPEAEVRQIALDAVPVGVLEAIEVSKTITPDMDADAIGGTVNLVTRKAPDARFVSFESSGGYAAIREEYSGLSSLTLGGRSADKKLGALFAGSWSRRNFGSDGIEPDYDFGDTRAEDGLAELDVRRYSLWRSRLGATGSVDYRLGDGSSLYLTSLYSALTDQEQRRRLTHALEDGEISYAHKNRKEILSTWNVMAGGEHLSRRGIKADYRLAFTRSQEDTPFDDEVFFLAEDVTFNPSLSDPDRPQPNPVGALGGPFLFDEAAPGVTLTRNRDVSASANLGLPFSFGSASSGTFKFGLKHRDKRKDQQVNERQFGLGDDANDIVLGSSVGTPFSNSGFNPGAYPIPFSTSPGDIHGFIQRFGSQLDGGEVNVEEGSNNYVLRERVTAAYGMAELSMARGVTLIPGVRVERTSLATDGFAFDSEDESLTATSGKNDYTNVFPMVHARWAVDDVTNLRASFTTAIFRPNFFDLVPYRVRDDEDLNIGNPALTATTSRQYDLLMERYDRDIGLVSFGVFAKQLSNPIFLATSDNDLGGETTQPVNATSGRLVGLEVAFQRRLTFLPGALSGLGIYSNFTWTDSKATQPNGRETRLAGQADRVGNFALSYERRRFSGQVSLNHTGRSILELGEDAEDDLFIDRRTQVDLSASFFVTRSAQVFAEANNLTNEPYRTYVIDRIRPRQIEYYEPWLQVGIRWRP